MILPPLAPPRPIPLLYPPKFVPFFLFLIRTQSSKITTKISTTTLDKKNT